MKATSKTHQSIVHLVELALFFALMVVLFFTPLGLITLGPLNLTLFFLPVIVGTLVLGLPSGLVLGLCFGVFSAIDAFTSPSTLAAMTVAVSPFWAVFMCIVPRLLIPINVHLVYRLLSKNGKHGKTSLAIASAAGTVTNTVFYLGTMYLIFFAAGLDTGLVLAVILGMGGIGALCETLIAAAAIPLIVIPLRKINK